MLQIYREYSWMSLYVKGDWQPSMTRKEGATNSWYPFAKWLKVFGNLDRQMLTALSGKISILVSYVFGLTLSCAYTVTGISFVWDEVEVYVSVVLS